MLKKGESEKGAANEGSSSRGAVAFQSADAEQVPQQTREVTRSAKWVAAALIEDLNRGALDVKAGMQSVATAVRNPRTSPINLTLEQLLTRLFFAFLLCSAVCVKFLSPSWIALALSTVLGVGLGLGLSYQYYANKCEKQELNQVVRALGSTPPGPPAWAHGCMGAPPHPAPICCPSQMSLNLGIKGIQHLVGSLPTWVTYSEVEKMEWVNQIMVEVWPFVDKGVCTFVKVWV
jgi:hypothetical protein